MHIFQSSSVHFFFSLGISDAFSEDLFDERVAGLQIPERRPGVDAVPLQIFSQLVRNRFVGENEAGV